MMPVVVLQIAGMWVRTMAYVWDACHHASCMCFMQLFLDIRDDHMTIQRNKLRMRIFYVGNYHLNDVMKYIWQSFHEL
jgi:hypothetical protein